MEDRDKPSKELKDAWHADPRNWKWGIFYYNPEDKRIFPPRKIKYRGWTVNFANRNSIIAMLLILVVMFLLIYLLNSYLKLLT